MVSFYTVIIHTYMILKIIFIVIYTAFLLFYEINEFWKFENEMKMNFKIKKINENLSIYVTCF